MRLAYLDAQSFNAAHAAELIRDQDRKRRAPFDNELGRSRAQLAAIDRHLRRAQAAVDRSKVAIARSRSTSRSAQRWAR